MCYNGLNVLQHPKKKREKLLGYILVANGNGISQANAGGPDTERTERGSGGERMQLSEAI